MIKVKKSVKIVIAIIVLLACAAGGIYYLNMPVVTPLAQAEPKTAQLSFLETGRVVSENTIKVYPLVQGEIISVNVTEGQSVSKGDVLCEIDTAPIELEIARVEGVINGYEAQIANLSLEREKAISDMKANRDSLINEKKALEAQEAASREILSNKNVSSEERERLQNIMVEQKQSDLARAQEDLRKAEILYNAGGLSQADYESAKALVEKYQNDLNISKHELIISGTDTAISDASYYEAMKASLSARIEAINQSIEKDYSTSMKAYYEALIQSERASIDKLRTNINNSKVTAPVDGVITSLNTKGTNVVSTNVEVAEITSNDQELVEAFVSTKDADNIKAGDMVELIMKRRNGDVHFFGAIDKVSTTAEIKRSAVGVEESKVKVSIKPDLTQLPADVQFGAGYDVDVRFITYSEDNKLTVPKTAVFTENDADMLWLVKNGKAQKVQVTKGLELRSEIVIEQGISAGDMLVSDADNEKLKNGVNIKGE